MLSTAIILGLWIAFVWTCTAAPLWPIPAQYALGEDVLWMSENVQFHYSILNTVSVDSRTCERHVQLLMTSSAQQRDEQCLQ